MWKQFIFIFFCFPELKFLFTSCDDFLAYGKSAAGGECPYCMNTCLATEKHLMIRHFKGASHFILNGIGRC